MNDTPARAVIEIDRVSIVFGHGNDQGQALALMDAGATREEIQAKTGQILGVHDCTLDVGEGEIVVLMGLSGSGKSTLLRAINGLNRVTRGAVRIATDDGVLDITAIGAARLRKIRTERVAMVFQQFALMPWRTVCENVAFGLEIAGMGAQERRARALEQLALVSLESWADRPVQELSGGMQQRVGLARAFATHAPILLMDEPFSALDPLIRTKLQDELLDLQRKLGRTIVFVSHDLDEALKLGNRIAIMEGGHIVQLGTPQEIILRPATEYVAEFVAHMNPLNVLRAAEVMRPLAPGEHIPADTPVMPIDTPVRDLIQGYLATPGHIYIAKADAVVGVVDSKTILQAVLRT